MVDSGLLIVSMEESGGLVVGIGTKCVEKSRRDPRGSIHFFMSVTWLVDNSESSNSFGKSCEMSN